MKKFICPIDSRIVLDIEDDFCMEQFAFGVFISIANCETPLPNSKCKMIAKGCIGCRTDKEYLLGIQENVSKGLKKHNEAKAQKGEI